MSLEKELVELKAALRTIVAILVREQWQHVSAWEAAINDIDGILAGELSPEEITSWTRNLAGYFGVGMGSLSDVFLGDDFEASREDLLVRLGRITRQVRTAPGYVPVIRRFLTVLEDRLLEAGMTGDAAKLRAVLRSGPLDLPSATAIVEDLARGVDSLPPTVALALAPARAELAAARNATEKR